MCSDIHESVSSRLERALEIAKTFVSAVPMRSEQKIADHAVDDVTTMRDHVQAALDGIAALKEACSEERTQTCHAKSVALARIRSWL